MKSSRDRAGAGPGSMIVQGVRVVYESCRISKACPQNVAISQLEHVGTKQKTVSSEMTAMARNCNEVIVNVGEC